MSRKDIDQLIARATKIGWVDLGYSGANHRLLLWPPTGDRVTLSNTPGHRSTQKARTDLERISGPLSPKTGPGRSKQQRAADRRRADSARASIKPVEPSSSSIAVPAVPQWKERLQQIRPDLPHTPTPPPPAPTSPTPPPSAPAPPRGPRFTAFCACPRCGFGELHWLRLPRTAPVPGPRPLRVDEQGFAVIRECRACGHEFGQT